MFEKQRSVVKIEKVEVSIRDTTNTQRRFSVRQWEAQNKINVAKGRPTIKLEEEENDIVIEHYWSLKDDSLC